MISEEEDKIIIVAGTFEKLVEQLACEERPGQIVYGGRQKEDETDHTTVIFVSKSDLLQFCVCVCVCVCVPKRNLFYVRRRKEGTERECVCESVREKERERERQKERERERERDRQTERERESMIIESFLHYCFLVLH